MHTSRIIPVFILAAACAACTSQSDEPSRAAEPPSPDSGCTALETRSPNASGQQPAFKGQTRICGVKSNAAFDVTVVARGLAHPWAVEPLPDGSFLVTERPGRMRIIAGSGTIGEPIIGLPAIDAGGQGGLLDVALSPSFGSDRTIFWSYTEPRQGGNGTSVARGALSADGRSVSQVQVIYRALPTYNNNMHFGSRLAFDRDGKLYITMGERSDAPMRQYAQRKDSHLGKTVRINPDGTTPSDNPFAREAGAQPQIWTLGHRNIQAAAIDAQGRFWVIEHGTRGGDEVNLIEKGKNYGWPIQAYGVEYSGSPISGASPVVSGMEQPRYYWDPVIAPSGAQFYSGSMFPAWRGSLFIGGLASKRLVRLTFDDTQVTGEEHLLTDRGQRIRDVREGPDGALYIVTDESNGELWRLAAPR